MSLSTSSPQAAILATIPTSAVFEGGVLAELNGNQVEPVTGGRVVEDPSCSTKSRARATVEHSIICLLLQLATS